MHLRNEDVGLRYARQPLSALLYLLHTSRNPTAMAAEPRVVYQVGYAQHLRDALPNATFVAFTGTPVSSEDRDTRAVFGDYIHIYDMQQARNDGADSRHLFRVTPG